MNKASLRLHYKEKRRAISLDARSAKSQILVKKIHLLKQYKDANSILFYCNTPEEPALLEALQIAQDQGKKTFVPRLEADKIHPTQINDVQALSAGRYGILEPLKPSDSTQEETHFDLILVPGIAFDKNGNRLGHGKGFYDELLKRISGFKVGLCFQEQISENELPIQAHDQAVDLVITDQSSYGAFTLSPSF